VEEGAKDIYLSVIVTVWNEEEENIRGTYLRLVKVLTECTPSYELIFVDDGSQEKTFKVLKDIFENDKNVKIVRLIRNFGQAAAFLAGFQFAKGATLVTIDIDLQYLPEDIPKLIDKIKKGYDLVSGWRKNRKDALFTRKIPSYIINKFIQKKTGIRFHDWGCFFNAFQSNLVRQLKDFDGNVRFLKPHLAHLASFPMEAEVRHCPRRIGRSKYSSFRLAKIALDIFFNFSLNPAPTNNPPFVVKEVIEQNKP